MNGAESLLETLARGGVELCFMNPGTSEIHLVAALDAVPRLRAVPCLFEGVASGAADGYARMAGKPACTLFHLGPGLSNALANLHNAHRAQVPMVNIVGDHATFHRPHDPPLASDIEGIARPFCKWQRSTRLAEELGRDGADAVAAARTAPGQIATLIVPADMAWSESGRVAELPSIVAPQLPDETRIREAARLLRNGVPTAIILGSGTTIGAPQMTAARIAAATGATLIAPFAFARIERGAGRPPIERIAYLTEQALRQLAEFQQIVLVGAPEPVAFFGHPSRPSRLAPQGCEIFTLAKPDEDCAGALESLADALNATRAEPMLQGLERPAAPQGEVTLASIAAAAGAALPEHAIVIDESITSGRGLMAATRGAPPHDWLVNPGGSIGLGLPLALGAAMACPDRPIICFEGDGSLMYTLQALWTAARESLAVTAVVFANRSYAILEGELAALGTNPGPRAQAPLRLAPPDIDFTGLSKSLGVRASRVTSLEEFATALRRGIASRAPNLIEVPLQPFVSTRGLDRAASGCPVVEPAKIENFLVAHVLEQFAAECRASAGGAIENDRFCPVEPAIVIGGRRIGPTFEHAARNVDCACHLAARLDFWRVAYIDDERPVLRDQRLRFLACDARNRLVRRFHHLSDSGRHALFSPPGHSCARPFSRGRSNNGTGTVAAGLRLPSTRCSAK
jgi:acetolactate synthase-1/2/3 large subunit